MVYATSIRDIVKHIDEAKLKRKFEVSKLTTISHKLVKRKGIEELLYEQAEVLLETPSGMPELDSATRRDIFDYYDLKLTNTFNRSLGNFTYQTTVKDGVVKQRKFSITKYSEDITSVLKVASTDEGLKYVVSNFTIPNSVNSDGDMLVDHLTSLFKEYEKTDILPLVYIEQFDLIPFEAPEINNKLLMDGDTLKVNDLSQVGLNNHTINGETILMDSKSDSLFLIDTVVINGVKTYTIKRLFSNDLFTNKFVK